MWVSATLHLIQPHTFHMGTWSADTLSALLKVIQDLTFGLEPESKSLIIRTLPGLLTEISAVWRMGWGWRVTHWTWVCGGGERYHAVLGVSKLCFWVSFFPASWWVGHGVGEVSVFFPSGLTQWEPQWDWGHERESPELCFPLWLPLSLFTSDIALFSSEHLMAYCWLPNTLESLLHVAPLLIRIYLHFSTRLLTFFWSPSQWNVGPK